MLALLVSLAAQAAAPAPSDLRTFRDWTVACDNGLACEAIALLPEVADPERWTMLSLRRAAEAGAPPVFVLPNIETAPDSLWVDGERIDARFANGDDGFVLEPADLRAFVGVLRRAGTLELHDVAGASLGVSLAGASAAMLYMDEAQRRLGTVTALVDPGVRPAVAVPAPPALPRVLVAPAPSDAPLELGAARIEALRRQAGCTIDETGGPDTHESIQIAQATTLVLIACGTGAYNFSSVPFIARRDGGRIDIMVAPFDSQWGVAAEGRPTLINAFWDADRRLLREFAKGRGMGDCGTHATYAWDGDRFRLVEQEEMDECRGSLDYIATWRTEIVRR